MDLAQLEVLSERLYNSLDSAERAHAETTLKCFSVNTDYILQCQYILDNAFTPYALMLASSSLLKQVTDHSLPLQLRIDIRNYLISYLATKGPDLEPFIIGSLIQVFCRVTKLGWFDDDKFREVVNDSMTFLTQTTSHYAIGLKVLDQLVCEMNKPNPGLPPTHHRRVACSFRDQSLHQIFHISLTSLSHFKNEAGNKLQELALSLSLKCLSFDFVGTSLDESSDEFGTVQTPYTWRSVLEDPSTLKIFFDYYATHKLPISKEALECLVLLASVRRSLFTDDAARLKYLATLVAGTKEILQKGKGLDDHDNYHEYCRLIGRFKTNYQLSELVNVEGYSDWIQLVAEFTLTSLQSWQWAGSSLYYLLGLWSRLVTSVRYLKGDTPSMLEEYVPKIVEGFISSRLDSPQAAFSDDLDENPLDNVEVLQDQLDCLPHLCRFQYERCGMYMMKILDPILQTYMEGANLQANEDKSQLPLIEAKLAWAVHIIAAILKTKQSYGSSEDSVETIDSKLSTIVLQLINVTDSGSHSRRYGEVSKQRLESAILTFFQQFRKAYVGDQAMYSSKKYYAFLSELVGLHDHVQVLNVIVGKIAANLKCYENETIVEHTLSLFLEMASGFMTGKTLVKLDTVKFIVHHSRDHFPFLENHRYSRNRTAFYYVIGCLIFMDDSPLQFKSSMDPLLRVIISLESTPEQMFRTDNIKYALIGLMRDLKGIAMATNSRRAYNVFFDWFYPAHMPLLVKGILHWSDTPEVTTPLLKLMAELVLNKSQRLMFDSSSPNGILLFREVTKLLVAYGSRILSLPNCADMYKYKYKGIWISVTILSRALTGNYVNFGVFELYCDRALVDALDITLKMILSIPLADILAYQKLTGAYFTFLEILLSKHISFVLNLDASNFMYVVGSLESGLKCLDKNITSQCASAVDSLATFYFNHITVAEEAPSPVILNLARHISDCPAFFPEILKTLFEIVLFEDTGVQWSLSRPMLSLMLISEEMFTNLKAQILDLQAVERRQHFALCFDGLMGDVTRSLDSKNRDRFTQNLTKFRNEFRAR